MCPNPQFPADLVTLTEEILNGKLRFRAIKLVGAIDFMTENIDRNDWVYKQIVSFVSNYSNY